MADLLVCDSNRDALAGAGLLLGTLEGVVTFRVVASLPEVSRLMHDVRRSYTRIFVCGVPGADLGSLLSALTVLQARGSRVYWFDPHEILWTSDLRDHLSQLDVEFRLPDGYRPETDRTAGIMLANLLDDGNRKALERERELRKAISELRSVDLGGPDWIALLDAVVHDHRLVTGRAIRAAALRIWDPDAPLTQAEARLISLHRAREARVERLLDALSEREAQFQEMLTFDAEGYPGLRYVRPKMFVEAVRRRLSAEYAQARVSRGWIYACRDPFRSGLDLQRCYLERLPDLDVSVHGYPYSATVRVEGGLNVDERLTKALETALEEERTGVRKPTSFGPDEDEVDW